MQASCFLYFGNGTTSATDIISAFPLQEPRAFSRWSNCSAFASESVIHVDACHSIQVPFLTERWFRGPYQLRWSQCQHCPISVDIREIMSSWFSIGFASQGRFLRCCCILQFRQRIFQSIALLIVGPCLISARFTVGLQWLPPGRNRQDSFQVKPISHDGSALVGQCKSKECDFWSFRLVAEPNLSRFQPFDY